MSRMKDTGLRLRFTEKAANIVNLSAFCDTKGSSLEQGLACDEVALESPEARAMRRALSVKLTRTINTSTDYPEIRLKVLEALEELNQRLNELESLAYAELHIDASRPLVRFR
jgi:hypothetical protein